MMLAQYGVFKTIQGEGVLIGVPMVFIRFAGCSVGCKECDTNYSFTHSDTASGIVERCVAAKGCVDWVWITGGEPSDWPLQDIVDGLKKNAFKVAIATSGVRRKAKCGKLLVDLADFLSVSPHSLSRLELSYGDQCNIVPGLNGMKLGDDVRCACEMFGAKFVTPMDGNQDSLRECLDWIDKYPEWRLGIQAHKHWGLA